MKSWFLLWLGFFCLPCLGGSTAMVLGSIWWFLQDVLIIHVDVFDNHWLIVDLCTRLPLERFQRLFLVISWVTDPPLYFSIPHSPSTFYICFYVKGLRGWTNSKVLKTSFRAGSVFLFPFFQRPCTQLGLFAGGLIDFSLGVRAIAHL